MTDPMTLPLVSVIIPAYNAERFIEETIQSVINQTYKNWEMIVVDDGSTDNTSRVVKNFFKDGRIQYVLQKNSGVSASRNHGFQLSNGKYVGFLDADDLWNEDFLTKKVAIMEGRAEIGVVSSNDYAINEKSEHMFLFFKGPDKNLQKNILEFKVDYSTSPANLLCRSENVKMIGGFNTQLSNAADKLFLLEMSRISEVYLIDEHLMYYRIHANSMHKNLDLMTNDYLKLFRILDSKSYFENSSHRNICWARMFKICGGAAIARQRYGKALKFILKSFKKSPKFIFIELFKFIRLRNLFFQIIYFLGIAEILQKFNKARGRIPVFLFHKIDMEIDPYWSSLHPHNFDKILGFLIKKYKFISIDDLFNGQTVNLKNAALIVFDDAYRDFSTYAAPILMKYEVPVTVFVPVKAIMGKSAIWTNQIDTCFKITDKNELTITIGERKSEFRFNNQKERILTSNKIQKMLQEIPTKEQIDKVEEIKEKLGYNKDWDLKLMSFDQMKAHQDHFSFQSHSLSHICFDRIETDALLIEELENSKKILEEKLCTDIRYIAYPIGKYSKHVEKVTSKYYDAAFAVDNELVDLNRLKDPFYRFRVPRFNISDSSQYEILFRVNGFHKIFQRLFNFS